MEHLEHRTLLTADNAPAYHNYMEVTTMTDEIKRRPPGRPRKTMPSNLPAKKVDVAALQASIDTDSADNSKYLLHALTIRNWDLIDTNDPVQVQDRISDYRFRVRPTVPTIRPSR